MRSAAPWLYLIGALVLILIISSAHAAATQWGPYPAQVKEVKDGDTFSALIETYPGEYILRDVRVAGANAPEMHGQCDAEKALAVKAKNRAAELLRQAGNAVSIIVTALDSWKRPVARVFANGKELAKVLLAEGLARPFAPHQWRDGYWCSKQREKGE